MTEKNIRIEAQNLKKSFQRASGEIVHALDNVDLQVKAGEFVVLLGPSGCGKTTLLRSIAGLETPESGEISVKDQQVYSSTQHVNVPPEKRNINMMFQSYALWPHMTVYQNVAYPLVSRKVKKEEIREKVETVLKKVGIPELAESHPADLSGGQQQRVALARALAVDPSCVLFDEPLSNVDAKVREQLRIELLDMHQRMEFSALYVTHDQVEAMQLADRLVVMRKGRIEQEGTPEEIYLRPKTRYVANFIGVSNEVIGSITDISKDAITLDTEFGSVTTGPADFEVKTGDEVALIIRPESVDIVTGASQAVNTWKVNVHTHMFAGAYSEYVVDFPNGWNMQLWDFNRSSYRIGDAITVHVDPAKIRMVPKEEA